MSRSLLRRLSGGIAAAALAVTGLAVAGAAPAQAATCATSITLKVDARSNQYGDWNSLNASTTSTCGSPFVGKTSIQRWTGSTWATVAHDSQGASYASYYGTKFNKTTIFRAVYSGGSSSSNTWQPSATGNLKVSVFRKVTVRDSSNRRASIGVFKIYPKASIKGKKAAFQVRKAGKWRKFKNVRVPATGKIRVSFPNSRKGIKYRMILPAARGMVKSVHGPYTATRR